MALATRTSRNVSSVGRMTQALLRLDHNLTTTLTRPAARMVAEEEGPRPSARDDQALRRRSVASLAGNLAADRACRTPIEVGLVGRRRAASVRPGGRMRAARVRAGPVRRQDR